MHEAKKCLILNLLEQITDLFLIFFYRKALFLKQGASTVKLYQYTEKT